MTDNKALLPYGGNISAPKIEVPDVAVFKKDRTNNAGNFFNEKIDALQREYDELVRLAQQTQMVYEAKYNFIPKVGHVYHLYWTGEHHLLSLIENWKRFEFVGSYRLTADNVWEEVTL